MPYLEGLPLPAYHVDYKEFWDGCKNHRLLIQRCGDCLLYRHYPGPICPKCRSFNAIWQQVSGLGTIWSWTVISSPIHSLTENKIPYNIVEVELAEQKGLRLTSNLIECPLDEISIGMPVKVYFEDISEEISLPRFKRRF
jgi:uncharacterized OB-fold protein